MYQDDREYQIEAEINHLNNLKRQLRQREKSINARALYLSQPSQFQNNNVKNLKNELVAALAPHMLPGNVGALNEVAWPFYFQTIIDFDTDPTISSNTIQRASFQVDQEASFILMSVSVQFGVDANGSALSTAPLAVEFIDRQSSRRFNSGPAPIQTFGSNSLPSVLPTGMLLMPNAFLDTEVRGIPLVAQSFVGSGEMQFSFFGYRTRVENAEKVLSTIFG
jgi:hypothetical protein